MARVLALDLGERRIGVAVSDPTGTVATPYAVVERSGDRVRDHRRIAELVAETAADRVVVGLPRSMDGRERTAARAARAEAEVLSAVVGVPTDLWDERLTTVTAQRSLVERGVRRKARKGTVDKVAAAVLLQSWLDAQR